MNDKTRDSFWHLMLAAADFIIYGIIGIILLILWFLFS